MHRIGLHPHHRCPLQQIEPGAMGLDSLQDRVITTVIGRVLSSSRLIHVHGATCVILYA